MELIVLEDGGIGGETHQRAVLLALGGGDDAALLLGDAFAVEYRRALSVTHTADVELGGQGVHSLDADTVQSHRTLVRLGVVLGTGVHLGRRGLDLIQGDAAAIVANGDCAIGHLNVDVGLGITCVELVDAVVDDLLDEDIDAVIVLRTVAQLADVHARALADVLARRERHHAVIAAKVAR